MPPASFTGAPGGHPPEGFFNHLPPSLLAAASASASQAGIPSNTLPFLNLPDVPPTISRDNEGEQGDTDKDTKLKEVLSHIYQYVSRQYNQRLNEQQEAPKRPSTNSLSHVGARLHGSCSFCDIVSRLGVANLFIRKIPILYLNRI